MQVRFLAEGLDGLAAALDSAMDGAAPRNLDPTTGTPVSAPLIGTDLDAGAGVPDILTELTSALRDELTAPAVAGKTTATTLKGELDNAVERAVDGTEGLAGIAATESTSTSRAAAPPGPARRARHPPPTAAPPRRASPTAPPAGARSRSAPR